MKTSMTRALAIAAAATLSGAAAADVVFDSGIPGGMFGYYGFDVSTSQSVAVGFTPDADYRLDDINLWIMSNDFDNPGRTMTVSLRTVAPGSIPATPGGDVLESWTFGTEAVGWSPVIDTLTSVAQPILSEGTQYWIVAESTEPGGLSPVWLISATNGPTDIALIDFVSGPNWQGGQVSDGGAPAAYVNGTVVPEPATLGMLGLALVGLIRRR